MSAYKDFNKMYSMDEISAIYNSKIKLKSTAGNDGIHLKAFEKRKKEYFNIIERKVKNNTYKFTKYKEKLILKGRDKLPRVISIPTIRDKITLKILSIIISNAFSEDTDHQLIHNIIDNIKTDIKSGNYDYFIKIDISNFYPSIDHDILLKKMRKRIRKAEIVDLIRRSLTTSTSNIKVTKIVDKGVPQGLSISNILADVYMNDLDIKFKNDNDVKYFRYVDDILILCKKNGMEQVERRLLKEIDKLELKVNEAKNKSGPINEGFTFLGYKYDTIYKFSVKKESILKIEKSLIEKIFKCKDTINHQEYKRAVWDLNLRITGCVIDEKKYGWLFYFSQTDDMSVVYHLDFLICDIINRKKFSRLKKENIKRFARVYNEIKYNLNDSNYFPNFDKYDIEKKKDILKNIFNHSDLDILTEEEIEISFKKNIYKQVNQLEKDVQNFS